jgi:hypothetical protein
VQLDHHAWARGLPVGEERQGRSHPCSSGVVCVQRSGRAGAIWLREKNHITAKGPRASTVGNGGFVVLVAPPAAAAAWSARRLIRAVFVTPQLEVQLFAACFEVCQGGGLADHRQ